MLLLYSISKVENIGASFYVFFADNLELLMEDATWRIQTHKLDRFAKAHKIKEIAQEDL